MVTDHPCFNPLSSKKFFPVGKKICFQQRKLLFIFQVGNRLVLEALVEAGADLNVQSGEREFSPLMSAARSQNQSCFTVSVCLFMFLHAKYLK